MLASESLERIQKPGKGLIGVRKEEAKEEAEESASSNYDSRFGKCGLYTSS